MTLISAKEAAEEEEEGTVSRPVSAAAGEEKTDTIKEESTATEAQTKDTSATQKSTLGVPWMNDIAVTVTRHASLCTFLYSSHFALFFRKKFWKEHSGPISINNMHKEGQK